MANTWTFTYYATFGYGDASDDVEFETEVSDEEYDFLQKVSDMLESEDDDVMMDLDEYLEENEELIDELTERLQIEAEELEQENYSAGFDGDGDDEVDDDEVPNITVRMPWE